MNPDSIDVARETCLGTPNIKPSSSPMADLTLTSSNKDVKEVSTPKPCVGLVGTEGFNNPKKSSCGSKEIEAQLPVVGLDIWQNLDKRIENEVVCLSSGNLDYVDKPSHCDGASTNTIVTEIVKSEDLKDSLDQRLCIEKGTVDQPFSVPKDDSKLSVTLYESVDGSLQRTVELLTEKPLYLASFCDETPITESSKIVEPEVTFSPMCVENNESINSSPVAALTQNNYCEDNVSVVGLSSVVDELEKPAEEMPVSPTNEPNLGPVYKFHNNIREITGAWNEFQSTKGECFTKGCKWAPDGTCILTNSEDNVLRIFDLPAELHCQESWPRSRTLPEMKPVLRMPEGGLIYDYCWYPLMSSWNPLSCCLVSTSQYSPLHLWDAFTGELRATYRAYNQVDEVVSANCVAFDRVGEKLYCGFNNAIRIFNTAVPGRHCDTRNLKSTNITIESQRGLVSCISVNPEMQKIYAVGSYLKSIGLYSEPDGTALCLLEAHTGGVSHLAFSPDGTKLFSGGRKDPEIICWDIRNPGAVLYSLRRQAGTNQRIYFDICPDGRYLLSGNSDGLVRVWDLLEAPDSTTAVLPTLRTFKAHDDCVNGLSVHQQYPIVATTSGQRHFAELSRDSGSDSDEAGSPILKRKYIRRENSLKLWWVGNTASS